MIIMTLQYFICTLYKIFKPGARAPGFLKLLWFARRYVCVSALEAINNQWGDMV